MSAPEPLPVQAFLSEITRMLAASGALVLAAEPGAGKTSLVPQAIADALAAGGPGARGGPRKVLVMEPRRVATVAAAARIAELWGKKLGDGVGYRVRGESSTSPRALVEVVTPGVLLRMVQSDPGLEESGCVILDEFHERSVQGDLAFALLAQARRLRPDLKVVAMSATMDVGRAAAALGAAVLEVPGRAFPVETRHASIPEGRGSEAAIARAALDLMREAGGDVLVFLPGAAEIARAAAEFSAIARPFGGGGHSPEAVALHGSLPLDAQRRVLSPPPGSAPRAIFATSVAETSLTVPRVRAVVDSGLARLSRFEARTGLNRLVTEREAQDRADQRRGRAGRTGPGICLRAWPASETLPARTESEIFRAELSGLVLEAALWGSLGRQDPAWLDHPPEGAWRAGTELLVALGALEASSRGTDPAPTDFGRRMAVLGTEPRLAALVLRGAEAGQGWTACLAAALLSERGGQGGAYLAGRLEDLASGREGGSGPVTAEARRLARAAGLAAGGNGRADPDALGPLLAAAFPDRIAVRTEYRGANASFRIPAGRLLRASGPLAQSPWIVALDADAGAAEGKVYSANALTEAQAAAALEKRATESVETEWKGLELKVRRIRRVGAIVLGTRPASPPAPDDLAALLAARLESEGLGILPWDQGADAALARLRFFAAGQVATGGGPSRDGPGSLDPASLTDAALAARATEWLGPFLATGGGPALDGPSLRRAVASLAPRELRSKLESGAPERLALPSGSSRQIDYSSPGGPSVEARVQEFFGMSEHPRVLGRSLVLRLLDPGGKPLQVTSDLPGFWRGSWSQARKELRGRYPRHEWPEDPAAASPSRSGIKKRGR